MTVIFHGKNVSVVLIYRVFEKEQTSFVYKFHGETNEKPHKPVYKMK